MDSSNIPNSSRILPSSSTESSPTGYIINPMASVRDKTTEVARRAFSLSNQPQSGASLPPISNPPGVAIKVSVVAAKAATTPRPISPFSRSVSTTLPPVAETVSKFIRYAEYKSPQLNRLNRRTSRGISIELPSLNPSRFGPFARTTSTPLSQSTLSSNRSLLSSTNNPLNSLQTPKPSFILTQPPTVSVSVTQVALSTLPRTPTTAHPLATLAPQTTAPATTAITQAGHHPPLAHTISATHLLRNIAPSTDTGSDVAVSATQMDKGISVIISGAGNDSTFHITDTQLQLLDLSSFFSGICDFLEARTTLTEANKAKSSALKMNAAALFMTSITKMTLGILAPIFAGLAMIPTIDLSGIANELTNTCASLLFIIFAIQSISSFITAVKCFDLHANLSRKTTLEKKIEYLKSFLPKNKLSLIKLIGERLLEKLEQGGLDEANIKKIENRVLFNGLMTLGASLIQSAIATLTLTSTILAPGLSNIVIGAFTIAIGTLFATNTLYDIGMTLSGVKNESIPALQNRAHRYRTAAIAFTSAIIATTLVVIANLVTFGGASIGILIIAAIIPPLLNLSYRLIAHYMHPKAHPTHPQQAGIGMTTIHPKPTTP